MQTQTFQSSSSFNNKKCNCKPIEQLVSGTHHQYLIKICVYCNEILESKIIK